jgi:predicted nucleotidyltransferase
MAIQAPTIDADLEAVKAALAGVQPRPGRVLLFGSRARGDARPDSDLNLLVVVGEEDAERLAGSRWHVVARALREGKELDVAG